MESRIKNTGPSISFPPRIPVHTEKDSYLWQPTQQEASEIFGVLQRIISNWVRKQEKIEKLGFASGIRSR